MRRFILDTQKLPSRRTPPLRSNDRHGLPDARRTDRKPDSELPTRRAGTHFKLTNEDISNKIVDGRPGEDHQYRADFQCRLSLRGCDFFGDWG